MSGQIEQKLADEFDIDLSEQQVEESAERIEEISAGIKEQKYSLEDKEYIRTELQSLIELNRTVLETMSEQCKLGAPPRMYEVFATLSNTVSDNLVKLMNLDKTMTDYQVRQADEELRERQIDQRQALINIKNQAPGTAQLTQINNNYNFTSNDLLAMLKQHEQPKGATPIEELPKFDLS